MNQLFNLIFIERAYLLIAGLLFIVGLVSVWLGAGITSPSRGGRETVVRAARKSASNAFESFTSIRYFSGLDALRGISVIGVIWTHVSGRHTLNLLNQGNRGVDLFFAISGFLVTTLLLREYRRDGRISLRDFYIRRTLRIFPLYYAVLFTYCVLMFFTLRGTPKAEEFWSNLAAFATYTSNWFVSTSNGADHGVTFYFAWSLATEEQFYLFWPPLIVLMLWKLRHQWALIFAALFLILVKLVAERYAEISLLATMLASLAPAILFGSAFAVLLNNRSAFNLVYPVVGHKYMASATGLLLVAMLQFNAPWLLVNAVMAVLVTSVCIREDTHLHPLLRWRPAMFLGTISYGIYLMHMLAANFVRKLLGHASGIDVFIVTTLVVIVMAYLSFRYFEAPILALKTRFQSQPRDLVRAPSAR